MKISTLCVLLCIGGADARIRGARPNNKKPLQEVVQRHRELKPLRELKTLDGFGGEPDPSLFPLGECEGDCDRDTDCADGLVCFQRGPAVNGVGTEVPGCEGGREFLVKTDFCIRDPAVPTWAPTFAPTFEPTAEGTFADPAQAATKAATSMPTANKLPLLDVVSLDIAPLQLGLCQGDCDTNDDCIDELICFQRDLNEEVPGCAGFGRTSVDYCIKPDGYEFDTTVVNSEPASGIVTIYPLETITDNGNLPLGLCQGDCDTDDDCLDNLICFQRDYLEPVPGCSGEGNATYDYCVQDPNADEEAVPGVVLSAQDVPPSGPPTKAPTLPGISATFDTDPPTFASTSSSPTGAPTAGATTFSPTVAATEAATGVPTAGPTTEIPVTGTPTAGPTTEIPVTGAPSAGPTTEIPVTGTPSAGPTMEITATGAPTAGPTTEIPVTGTPTETPTTTMVDESESVIVVELVEVSDNSNLPLGRCQGDCDSDSDCLDNLVCYQRDALEAVPGCVGTGIAAYDYCVFAEEGTTLNADADNGTMSPGEEEDALPLGLCEGDCDVDADCLDELVCFQRDADEDIPGCADGITGTDYCVKPAEDDGQVLLVTSAPTEATTMNVSGVSLLPLVSITGEADGPLGLCQGDCDTDEDCLDDLVCFQRDMLDPVPGCRGEGRTSYDYCIRPATATEPPTRPPTDPTQALPFGICEAGCGGDINCLDELVCFVRQGNETVPGCEDGEAEFAVNYCILPPMAVQDLPVAPEDDNNDASSVLPLSVCQGDCDTDDDCEGDLICFQREGLEPVPGCSGLGQTSYDYCIVAEIAVVEAPVDVADAPTMTPTMPTPAVVESAIEASEAPLPELTIFDSKDDKKGAAGTIFGLCEGDCDDDSDCESDLYCLQRVEGESAPGCSGTSEGKNGYCVSI